MLNTLPPVVVATAICVFVASIGKAQSLTWDVNPTVTGAQGGNGIWAGESNWWNGSSNQSWISGADASFSGNGTVDGKGTVDVGNITVDDISISAREYVFKAGQGGGVLTFGGGEGEHIISGFTQMPAIFDIPIAGTGGITVNFSSSGDVTFRAANTYAGDTKVLSGRIIIEHANAIPDSSTVIISNSGNPTYTGLWVSTEATIGGLSGSGGSVAIWRDLRVGSNNSSTTYNGAISGNGACKLIKLGNGTLTLAGETSGVNLSVTENGSLKLIGKTSSSITDVQSGSLISSHSASSLGDTTIAAGARLQVEDSLTVFYLQGAGDIILGGASVLSVASSAFAGNISGTGSVAVRQGTFIAQRDFEFSGGILVTDGGVISTADLGSAGFAGPLGKGTVTIGDRQLSDQGTLRFTGNGAITSDRPLSIGGTTAAPQSGSALEISNPDAKLTMKGLLSGTGRLVKTGPGTLVLDNPANSFADGVTVKNGTLVLSEIANLGAPSLIGTGGTIALLGGDLLITGAGTYSTDRKFLAGGGSLNLASGTTLTLTTPIESWPLTFSPTWRKSGIGTLVLAANANNYGPKETMLDAGVLKVMGGTPLSDKSVVNVATGATFLIASNAGIAALSGNGLAEIGPNTLTLTSTGYFESLTRTFSGIATGSGSIIKLGLGIQTLEGRNSFSGGLFINDGFIAVPDFGKEGENGPLGTGPVILNGGGLAYPGAGLLVADRQITLGQAGGKIMVSHPAGELLFDSPLNGRVSLSKVGAGRLHWRSQSSGSIVVEEGALTPEIDISGLVKVNKLGVIATHGGPVRTFSNLFLAGGTLSPGGDATPGVLAAAQLTLESGTLSLDFESSSEGGFDYLAIAEMVKLSGFVDLKLNFIYDPEDRVDRFQIVMSDAPIVLGDPNARFRYNGNVLEDGEEFLVQSVSNQQYVGIRYNPQGLNGVELFAAPEPNVGLLLLGSYTCISCIRRRQRRC